MDPRHYQQQKEAHGIQQEEEKKNKKKRRPEQDLEEVEEQDRVRSKPPQPQLQPQKQPQKQPQTEPIQQYKELNEEAILFTDKNEKEITDKQRRDKVVESHKIAKKMLECAEDCIRECKKSNPDPQQKKLYEKWKVGPQIEQTINTCVEEVTDVHNYIDEAKDSTDSRHDLAFVYVKDCGEKLHLIHLYTKFFQQPSEIAALTLVHEMTHDNSNTEDEDMIDEDMKDEDKKDEDMKDEDDKKLKTIENYINVTEKFDGDNWKFVLHMMKQYPNEMKEALNSQEVKEECKQLDQENEDTEVTTLLTKYKTITPETADSIELNVDELDASLQLNQVVLCKHISMDRACLLEIFPEKAANDAECIARFAYDCYKYKQDKYY